MKTELPTTCPHCGKQQDLHSGLVDKNAVPAPGDISFCFSCGGLSAYGEDLQLVELTPAQRSFADTDRDIRKATEAWLQIKGRRLG